MNTRHLAPSLELPKPANCLTPPVSLTQSNPAFSDEEEGGRSPSRPAAGKVNEGHAWRGGGMPPICLHALAPVQVLLSDRR
jgi:hypothetical protein